jgi:hypothetical protein|tara:strand:+ start:3160 stop:3354 length:195 start_codon:yes stop_codon:yes gene_type:complete
MAKKKKKIIQPINEVEIINRRTRRFRKINFKNKEKVIYNEELNEFQLLPPISASYDENSVSKNE